MEIVQVQRNGPVMRVTIPSTIDAALTCDMLQLLRDAEADDAIRLLAIEGDSKLFCTGLDFADFSRTDAGMAFTQDAERYYDVLSAMVTSSKFIVSMVAGKVNAGGMGFVAASDLVIAGPDATFALSELLFELLPACVLPFLIRRVGLHKAQLLALTTQPIGVEEAYRWGLVDEWGPELEQLFRRRVPRVARMSPAAIGRLKKYMNDLWIIREETRHLAVNAISRLLGNQETQTKIRRFVSEGALPWQT
jgi:polyketide biosynthesis enoyl-CoA hydratase PksH